MYHSWQNPGVQETTMDNCEPTIIKSKNNDKIKKVCHNSKHKNLILTQSKGM